MLFRDPLSRTTIAPQARWLQWGSLTLALAGGAVDEAWAESSGDADSGLIEDLQQDSAPLEVIQNRKYDLASEFRFSVGTFPADPYVKGLAGTVGYALHLSDVWAWEVASFTYAYNLDASLKEEVQRIALQSGSEPPEFPELAWMVASRLVLKPLYGKKALFNTDVVHLEAFLHFGPAFVRREQTQRQNGYGLDVGAGVRLWLTSVFSVRLDLGELVYLVPQGAGQAMSVEQALHLHLGASFNLRSED